jgi:hypothetical protein
MMTLFAGCSHNPPPPVEVEVSNRHVDYLADVKPIFERRCVVCHSCYNSPCQLKLSSFEGVDRGGSKARVYLAERLIPQEPTRLFTDAMTTGQWRESGFFSVTENSAEAGYNNTIMAQLLHAKMQHPKSEGEYHAEAHDLMCAKNGNELGEFLEKHPNRGMPFGFPALKQEEYATILQWLQQGAKGPTPKQQRELTSPSPEAAAEIVKWEKFLNTDDAKHAMTARYLYEHLFLAHLHFKAAPMEFFEVVRSATPPGCVIEIIPTVRPYDDPDVEKVYYRIRKIHSTIVHKTHMVFELDDAKLARFNALFIAPEWLETPHIVGYDEKTSANPFLTYAQIPPRSRYQFLLDNSHYIVMTFIRGPVCKGQIALNVIHDHFWVMFLDPDSDLSVRHPGFLVDQAENLSMPIEKGSSLGVFSTFSDRYRERYANYFDAKRTFYRQLRPEGFGIDAIWRGGKPEDAPILTVYRHFDSASVHKGVLGELPRTMWVIDYPQFERIYYALVAGFDVFGNVSHQTNVRRYMDFLRAEGELNFLALMPQKKRQAMFCSWYVDEAAVKDVDFSNKPLGTKIVYKTDDPKRELIERVVNELILPSTGIAFDDVNYFRADEPLPALPKVYRTREDYITGFRAISLPGTAFMRYINGYNANLALIRIKMPEGEDIVVTVVINRWHDNVNALFDEHERLDPSKDTADFIRGSIGSYPNFFLEVKFEELPDFFDMLAHYEDNEAYVAKFLKYGIGREEENFWEHYDWFQKRFYEQEPLEGGLYDLNRYYFKAW